MDQTNELLKLRFREWWPYLAGFLLALTGLSLMLIAGCSQPEVRESGKVAGNFADHIIPGSGWIVEPLVTAIVGAVVGGSTVHVHHKRKAKKAAESKARGK